MLEKSYQPQNIEENIYQLWESAGLFSAGKDAMPWTVMMPPPNVTGNLHMGHALNMTLQDILTRYFRMCGRDALWQPGTDHAGIATQMVVERKLAAAKEDLSDVGVFTSYINGAKEFPMTLWESIVAEATPGKVEVLKEIIVKESLLNIRLDTEFQINR